MIKVSDKLRALLNSGSAPAPKIKIKTGAYIFGYDDETDSSHPVEQNNILSLQLHYVGASDDYPLGCANSNYIDAELWNIDSDVIFQGREAKVYIGYEVGGIVEWVNAGTFFPEKPARSGQITSFTAYDRMKTLTDLYIPSLNENSEHTILAYLADIANQFGFYFKSASFPLLTTKLKTSLFTSSTADDETGKIKYIGNTVQDTIAYLAGAAGCNAMFNRNDELQLYQFSKADYELTDDNTNNPSISEVDNHICFISNDNDKRVLISPKSSDDWKGSTGISIENLLIETQAHLDSVFSEISERSEPFSYRVISLEHLTGDITLECFDVVEYTDVNGNNYKLPVMKLDYIYDGGLICNISSVGKTEAEAQNEPSTLDAMNSKISSAEQAIGNINSTLSEFRTSYTELIQSSQSIIMQAVQECAKTKDLEALKETVSAQLEITAAGINMNFTELQEKVNKDTAGANEQLNVINKYIHFNNGTIEIGEQGNITDLTMNNEEFLINRNGEAKAYMNSDGFNIDSILAQKKLAVGNFALIPRSSGNLSFKKIRQV